MDIALLGANGQLGTDLDRVLHSHNVAALTIDDFDVTDHARTREVLTDLRPHAVVNTTAFLRVADCKTRAEVAYTVNAASVLNMVRIANDLDAVFVHFSTDYVFDGKAREPYTEESPPFPLSVYANSKLAGELLVRAYSRKYFLIRSSGLYGHAGSMGKGGNFVETMLAKAKRGESIRVVNDQILTPTYTVDLADQVSVLLSTSHYGLFHATNEGSCSWFEFAQAIFDLAKIDAQLLPTTSS